MWSVTIGFGMVLILLGVGGYVGTGRESVTALIPAFFGLALVVLGALARKEGLRKHVMHAAVLIGLVGFAVPAYRAGPKIPALFAGDEGVNVAAVSLQLAMAAICAVFVVLCVKSFIDARRSRAAAGKP